MSNSRRKFKVRKPSETIPATIPPVEEYEQYVITKDKDWTIVRPKAINGVKVHFWSPESLSILSRCTETILAEARKRIEERVPNDGWYKNFSACNIDTSEAFKETLDIALCVERDENVDGSLLLIVSVVSKERPSHDISRGLYFGSRELVLEYLGTPEAQIDLQKVINNLMGEVARMK